MPVIKKDFKNINYITNLIKTQGVTHIINCAASKHVGFCEDFIDDAIDINILSNLNLLESIKDMEVDFLFISSDKAIQPTNIYALTKQFTDYIVKKFNGKIVRGVNFLGSNGSVIDIWENQLRLDFPFSVAKQNCTRYFVTLGEMSSLVKKAMESDNIFFYPDTIYVIELHTLFDGFLKYHNLDKSKIKIKYFDILDCEKKEEEIDFPAKLISYSSPEDVSILLEKSYRL